MHISTGEVRLAGQTIKLETGKLARQANASIVASMGDNVVLATVVMGRVIEELDYFPLQVEFQEKLYSGGKIKGSRWVKREGRPSDESVMTARLIDRSIRPLFPKDFRNEVQVIVTTLSVDGTNPVDILSLLAVSTALTISDIPWKGPVVGFRVGKDAKTGNLLFNPTFEEITASQMMVEAGANEVSEATLIEAFSRCQALTKETLADLTAFTKKAGIAKVAYEAVAKETVLYDGIVKNYKKEVSDIVKAKGQLLRQAEQPVMEKLVDIYGEKYTKKQIGTALSEAISAEARRMILARGIRADGRKPEDIRPVSAEAGVLPRTHGSALFNRGETQALTITTLASPAMEQLIEGAEGDETKRYIHHYYMPPYTVGETGRLGWPSRREVGHGALAERALAPMIPSAEEFPYTIRVVSEIMSSNGSTSMASVCGSTLSLMDAGVKIKRPVAGIAMGLVNDRTKTVVLSDITGFEDHIGDMDFKIAGTTEGVTAMQMDVKVDGVDGETLKSALEQAKSGRLAILVKMLAVLSQPRDKLSPFAPKIIIITVPVDRIGEVIGPGGKIIRSIVAQSGAQLDIDDTGKVFISGPDEEAVGKARQLVEAIVREVQVGEEFDGKVTRLMGFGAFVEIYPGKEGLVHVSRMSSNYVADPAQVVQIGDMVHVRVVKVDEIGRVDLTMLSAEDEQKAESRRRENQDRGGYNQQDRRRRFGGGERRNRY